MNRGKEICEKLKSIRKEIAERYGLNYNPTECNHQGDCAGTCPKCDEETADIQRQLAERGIHLLDSIFEIEPYIPDSNSKFELRRNDFDRPQGYILPGRPMDDNPFFPDDNPFSSEETSDEPIFSFKKKRVLYKECQIAGITFHDLNDIWDELEEGTKLALVRHKDNKYDKYAVAVALDDDYDGNPDDFDFDFILGYVPRTENKEIATLMDMGWDEVFECEVSRIIGDSPYRGRIDINIYIVSKEEYLEKCNSIRVLELNDDDYQEMTDDLQTNGCIYFRWGGFPPWENNLPKKDEKIVLMHKNEDYITLYLMHCIADNDNDAAYFTQDRSGTADDCSYYVFTNIKGPLNILYEDLDFLQHESINTSNTNPESFLSEQATQRLKEIMEVDFD